MKTIKVVAAVIHTGTPARIFAAARGYGPSKGLWEFPGGKIEPGESPEQALKREILEELDADIRVEEFIKTIEYTYPDFHLSMDCYWCSLNSPHLILREALDARWLDKSQLRDVPWLPADLALLPEIADLLEKQA